MTDIYKKDQWLVAKGFGDGPPILIRTRAGLPEKSDRLRYDQLITILWRYNGNEWGMPAYQVNQDMVRLEDVLHASVESDGVAVHVACLTGNGAKEWRYYTRDKEEFMDRLKRGLTGFAEYQIEVKLLSDPDWNALSQLLPKS